MRNFGQVQDLRLDTRGRNASISVLLKGEAAPVTIEVHDYQVSRSEGADWIQINRVTASREWMTLALQEYIVGQRFKLPAGVGGFL